jgi:phospholipase C
MQGFVQNYATNSGNPAQGENVMKCFHSGSLPVLSTLAKKYAVCDHWFSSVPGSTIPNRLFAHAASSGDSLTQDAILAPATAKTIFQIIDDPNNDATYRIYSSGATILMANLYLAHHQNKFFDYSRFQDDCTDNLLPEWRPSSFARRIPARTRSTIRLRSSSAMPPMMTTMARPSGPPVSICSRKLTNSTLRQPDHRLTSIHNES